MKPTLDIKIVPATMEDAPAIAIFLSKFFFPDEPLNSSLGRNPPPENSPFIDVLKEGLSFKALASAPDKSENDLVGVVLNKETSLSKKKNLNVEEDPKRLKIYKLLEELDRRSKIWEVVNNENHFNVLSVSVNNQYRGYGIGRKLVEKSLDFAKSLNYRYASIECSSFYSAKFALEMGFELLGEISYEEYLDENGERIFNIKEPHKAVKKLIKRL